MRSRVLDLDFCDYDFAHALQLQLAEQLKRNNGPEYLIFCEHNNIFTIGRQGSRGNILVSDEYLKKENIGVRFIERGGDVTYHGPGQLVIYPVLDLRKRGKDIALFLGQLEDIAVKLLSRYGLKGERIKGARGVWVSGKKVASIGVAFRSWVSFHGLSINLNCDMRFFNLIYPCGMKDKVCASVSELSGQPADIAFAKEAVLDIARDVFNTEWVKDEKIPLVA